MSARHELAGILEQWLELTQEEGAAIDQAGWEEVSRLQLRKTALQEPLAAAFRKCAEEDAADYPGQPAVVPFRAEVGRIVSLLTHNAEAVTEKLRQARAQQSTLEESNRTLHKIQSSYVRPQSAAAWQSYS